MKRLSSGIAGLLALAACHSQPSSGTDTPAVAQAPATAVAAVADSPGASYRVYRGLLPGRADSITLHLVTAPQPRYDAGGISRYGSYYGADGHPYEVQSLSSAPDSVVLTDLSLEHSGPIREGNSAQPVWHLKLQPGGSLAGTDAAGRPLHLRQVPAPVGSLTFAVRCFADSLPAYPKDPTHSPRARLNLQALVPVSGPAALAANLLRDLRGDSLGNLPVPGLPTLYQQQRSLFFKDYRADVDTLQAHAEPGEQPSATLNYEDQSSVAVLFQQGNLLSLGFFSYAYSGGAHGSNGTTVASYDLHTGSRLRYRDIFLPAAATQLPALLEQAVRPLMGLKPGEALDSQLFVTKMPVTHNVCLTSGGALFVYEPYEIASYAQGEVRVFVPLTQLRGLLREGLPLPGTGSVAAR